MSEEKLSFQEWKEKYITITPQVYEGLAEFHPDIDIDGEINSVLEKEYNFYINGGYDNE